MQTHPMRSRRLFRNSAATRIVEAIARVAGPPREDLLPPAEVLAAQSGARPCLRHERVPTTVTYTWGTQSRVHHAREIKSPASMMTRSNLRRAYTENQHAQPRGQNTKEATALFGHRAGRLMKFSTDVMRRLGPLGCIHLEDHAERILERRRRDTKK